MPTNYNGYTVPEPTDIADAPAAFEQFSDSIPFNEYVAIESLSADTTVVDSYNGKMIFATADLTLTFGTLTDGFSVAITADTGVTVDYLGVDKASQQTTAFQIATVVAVNGTNIISIAGGACPPCPPCPPAGTPEATISAITGSGITHTYGSYIAYEFLTSGTITSTEGTVPEALIIGGGASGGASSSGAGGGGAGGYLEATDVYLSSGTVSCVVGDGGEASSPGNGSSTASGLNGLASQLGEYYSPGGGGGATNTFSYNTTPSFSNAGNNGGSGGGAAYAASGGILTGGLGVSGLGFDGGTCTSAGHGGGGGASAAGGNGVASPGASGGDGKSSSITGVAVTRAGGGGAFASGTGGTGGGGSGGGTGASTGGSGDVNTGSGGAGGGGTSGEGGSGVVIVKVLATNASSVDTTGWIEVTAAMLAAAEKKRKAEIKKLEKKLALQLKSEELSGQTNKTDIKENK